MTNRLFTAPESAPQESSSRIEFRPGSINKNSGDNAAEVIINCIAYDLDEHISPTEAMEIFGKDFHGVDRIQNILGQYWYNQVPRINATREELEIAKKRGKRLVLMAQTLPDGTPATMEKIHEYREKVNTKSDPEKQWPALFYSPISGKLQLLGEALSGKSEPRKPKKRWYEDREWYTNQTPSFGWALVSNGILEGSGGKSLFERIEMCVEDLRAILSSMKDGRFSNYKAIIDRFDTNKERLREIFQATSKQGWDGWDATWNLLMKLPVARLILPTPVEVAYANVLGASIFETNNLSTWTPTLALSEKGGMPMAGHCENGLQFETAYGTREAPWRISHGIMSIIRLNGQIPTPANGTSARRIQTQTQTEIKALGQY